MQDKGNYTCMYLWHQADMNVGKVGRTTSKLKLPESLDKWHPLNITNGTTKLGRNEIILYQMNISPRPFLSLSTDISLYLNDTDVWSFLITGYWNLGHSLHPLLNRISDMWNHCIRP